MAASASFPDANKISSICFKSRTPSFNVVSNGLGITFIFDMFNSSLLFVQLKSIKENPIRYTETFCKKVYLTISPNLSL